MAIDDRADRYPFREIEAEVAARPGRTASSFKVTEDPARPKYYCLEMFPYPSGRIHMGHVRVYAIGDLLARYKWMRGLQRAPSRWAGMPSGCPRRTRPSTTACTPRCGRYENIANMQHAAQAPGHVLRLGPRGRHLRSAYYRWEQLVFIRMFERGLAYKQRSKVNWCPSCQTVLANEQVENGPLLALRLRGHHQGDRGLVLQDHRLRRGAPRRGWTSCPGWPERVLTMQRNWIGKSEGAEFELPVAGAADLAITDLHHAPRHVVRHDVRGAGPRAPARGQPRRRTRRSAERVDGLPAEVARETEIERLAADRPKRGLRLGRARRQSVHREGDPALPRRLRAHGLRHGRHHGGARRRPARLGLRQAARARRSSPP